MSLVIPTERLELALESTEALLARIEAMSPADRAEVSPVWLAQLRAVGAGRSLDPRLCDG